MSSFFCSQEKNLNRQRKRKSASQATALGVFVDTWGSVGCGSEGGGMRSGTDLALEDIGCDTLQYADGEYRPLPSAVLAF
jgi:hypothetical protein